MVKNDDCGYSRHIDVVIIALVSLIPLIWILGGYVILGHDAGKPLDPQMHFLDRLNTWTHRYGIGADQTFALAGFFIHGYEYILSKSGLSLSLQQGFEYITYFMAIGYSMYFFTRKLFPNNRYLPITAALFYEINHFVLQGWFIVERTKFTLYIALPLILAQIVDVNSGKSSPIRAGIITSLILLVLNGGGFLPLYGSLFLVMGIFIPMIWLKSKNKKRFLIDYCAYFVLTIGFSVVFQSYWIFPYAYYIYRDFSSEIVKYGGGSVVSWIAAISEFASFANLMRLQGIQEWYINPQHSYAKHFLNNVSLVLISYLLPLTAFGSILISQIKDRYKLVIFGMIAIVSMFFMAGSHPPLGYFYLLLIKHVPGFIAFRTPFYKFAAGLWLSYSVMIGYTINHIFTQKLPKFPSLFVYLIITISIVSYSFPIVGTGFFAYGKSRTNRVKVPEYVIDYGKWAQTDKNTFNRILILPPHAPGSLATSLQWGYWSLAPINSLLDPGSYIDQNLTYTPEEAQIVNELYQKIELLDNSWLYTAKLLNIDGVLLQKDFMPYLVNDNLVSSDKYEKYIAEIATEKSVDFGKWKLYRIQKTPSPINTAVGYYSVKHKDNTLDNTIQNRIIDISIPRSVFISQISSKPIAADLKIADVVVPKCANCLLLEQIIGPQDHNITNLPGSRFYFLKAWLESYQLRYAGSNINRAEIATYQLTKRLYEYDNMYVFNLPTNKKHATINLYLQKISELKSALKSIYKNEILPNDEEIIIKIYNTLLVHNKSLANYIENDYDPELTERLILLNKKILEISNSISTNSTFSTEISLKKFKFDIQNPGEYEVYLHTPSVSFDNNDQSGLIFKIGNQEKQIKIDRSLPWQSLGVFAFDKTTSSALIEEKSSEIILTAESHTLVNSLERYRKTLVSADTKTAIKPPCLTIPLSSLNREKYLFDLQLEADQDTKIWTFLVDSKNALSKLNREHGQYMRIRKDKSLNINLKFQIEQPEHFSYLICQFDQKNRSGNPIKISSLRVSRITSPKLYFFKKNSNFISNPTREIKMKSKSNTKYEFSVAPGEKQFLLLDQRYNHNWAMATDSKQTNPAIKINRYQNGWILEKSNIESKKTVTYLMQDIFWLFSSISLIGVISAVLILIKIRR